MDNRTHASLQADIHLHYGIFAVVDTHGASGDFIGHVRAWEGTQSEAETIARLLPSGEGGRRTYAVEPVHPKTHEIRNDLLYRIETESKTS